MKITIFVSFFKIYILGYDFDSVGFIVCIIIAIIIHLVCFKFYFHIMLYFILPFSFHEPIFFYFFLLRSCDS